MLADFGRWVKDFLALEWEKALLCGEKLACHICSKTLSYAGDLNIQ
jgi:hypothetical protein